MFVRLPEGCGSFYGKGVRLKRSLYVLKQGSLWWHRQLISPIKTADRRVVFFDWPKGGMLRYLQWFLRMVFFAVRRKA